MRAARWHHSDRGRGGGLRDWTFCDAQAPQGRELLAAGMAASSIDHRVRAGRMRPIHRGVYLVGPVTPPHAMPMAAVLASGEGAVLSHRSAAHLLGLTPGRAVPEPVEVTIAGRDPGRRPGVRAHRVRELAADEVTVHERIPVTTAARVALDLAAELPLDEVEQLVAEAHRRDRASAAAIHRLLERHRGRRGTAALRALLAHGDPAYTRSHPERRLLRMLRAARLPPPEVNAQLGRFEIDLLWREQMLAVEVDGYAFHSSRPDRERDHSRDAELLRRGCRLIRLSPRQIEREQTATIALIARELGPAAPHTRSKPPRVRR